MSLTKALFGVSSDIEVQPEITEEFVRMGLRGTADFRYYLRELECIHVYEQILLEIYREARKRTALENYRRILASVCLALGSYYVNKDYTKAEEFLLESFNLRINLYHKPEEAVQLARTMNSLGILYGVNRMYGKSEVMFQDQYTLLMDLYQKYGTNEEDYAIAANNLGNLYFDLDKLDESLELFFEALEHKNVLKDVGTSVYYNIALVYGHLDQTEKAAEYYFKAACSLFLRGGPFNIDDLLDKASKRSRDPDIYAFYVCYLVSEGLMDTEEARYELSRLELDKCKFVYDLLDSKEFEIEKFKYRLRTTAHDVLGECVRVYPYPIPKSSVTLRLMQERSKKIAMLCGERELEYRSWFDHYLEDWEAVRQKIIESGVGRTEEVEDWIKNYMSKGKADLEELEDILNVKKANF
ncbi:MAG: tetratricopeptide repeat protein [Archaeoglobaceae archaeon]